MPRITKGQVSAARANLETIRSLAEESYNGSAACYQFHANSANSSIEILERTGHALPKWLVENWRHLRVLGWHGDFMWRKQAEADALPYGRGIRR